MSSVWIRKTKPKDKDTRPSKVTRYYPTSKPLTLSKKGNFITVLSVSKVRSGLQT